MEKTLMWEAKPAPGQEAELLAWVLAHAPASAGVYRGGDGRVVVIDASGDPMPSAPPAFMDRPAHAWRFECVRPAAGTD